MDEKELRSYRQALIRRRKTIRDELRRLLREEVNLHHQSHPDEGADDPDSVSVNLIKETQLWALNQKKDELEAIIQALRLVEEGTYGICVECGCRIHPRRLKIMPQATRCVTCQAEAEKL